MPVDRLIETRKENGAGNDRNPARDRPFPADLRYVFLNGKRRGEGTGQGAARWRVSVVNP